MLVNPVRLVEVFAFNIVQLLDRLWRIVVAGKMRSLILFATIVPVALFFLMVFKGVPYVALYLFLGLIFIGIGSFFFDKLILLSIPLMFIPFWLHGLVITEWFVIVLAIVALLKGFSFKLRVNELIPMVLFLVFVFSTLPSLTNSIDRNGMFFPYLHFVAIGTIAVLVYITINSYQHLFRFVFVFVIIACINSIQILCYHGDEDRFFGFAGVMFIDYAGISTVVTAVMSATSRRWRHRIAWGITSVVLFLGLISTQTRNPVPVVAATLCALGMVVFLKSALFGLTKQKIIKTGIVVLAFALIAANVLLSVNPKFAARIQSGSFKNMEISSERDIGANSMLTRVLIWDTALNGLKQHPFFGIGMFSFPRVSEQYSTLNRVVYDLYVRNLSQHLGYLMILSEAGILGLLVFLFFIAGWLRHGLQTINLSKDPVSLRCAMVVLGIALYLVFSLGVTDCWLWGNGAVLFGISIGLTMALRKIAVGHGMNNRIAHEKI